MSKMINAPFDEKNLTTDWIEDLFDLHTALYSHRTYVGFIDDKPIIIHIADNTLLLVNADNKQIQSIYERIQEILNDFDEGNTKVIAIREGNAIRFYFEIEEN